ncbi:MAG TPA: hypothetical protein VKY65_09795 [Alphaproteobacteria bacterium]|nr:hypothetical protein [Alphaproteobacteria bacterium]
MHRQDLRASIIIAAIWLLGVTGYAIWLDQTPARQESGIYNAFGPLPVTQKIFADENAPKHNKVPVRWAHQRWGAV